MTHSQNNTHGIVYMIMGIFFLSIMDAVAKWLVKDTVDPVQLIAIRSWLVVSLVYIFFVLKNRQSELVPNRPKAQVVRGLFGFLAPYCFFKSLQTLPLADAAVIFFSSTFMITALSWPLLKEKVGIHRWIAVMIGFTGVLIAMQPEGGGELKSYLYCLAGSLAYALLFISGRWLSRTESVISLVFSFNMGLAIVSSVLLPFVWVSMSVNVIIVIFIFSLMALSGHICITTAFSKAPVGVIAPFEYSALIWTTVLGYLIWKELPTINVILGAGIIVVCGLYVIYKESKYNTNKLPKSV